MYAAPAASAVALPVNPTYPVASPSRFPDLGGAPAGRAWPAQGRAIGRAGVALHARLPAEAARRLRTACVGDELYHGTYAIVVTREWPVHLPRCLVDAWWPMLAPGPRLLRAPRGPDGARMPWATFAARYRAALDGLPLGVQHTTVVRLGWLLHRYPTVTPLSCEPGRGRPEAEAHTQRRALRDWLVG